MCNKVAFTIKQARTALNKAKRENRDGKLKRRECRIYFCKECKMWHLTSNKGDFKF